MDKIKEMLLDLISDGLNPSNKHGEPTNPTAEWFGHLLKDDPLFYL